VIARLDLGQASQGGLVYDGIASKDFCRALLELMSSQQNVEGKRGRLEPTPGLIHLFLGTGSDRRWWSGLCEVLSTGVPSGF
jgi:hypothetical protein